MQNSKVVPKIPTPWCTWLNNPFPLSVGRTCGYDGFFSHEKPLQLYAKVKGLRRHDEGSKSVDSEVVTREIGLGGLHQRSPSKEGAGLPAGESQSSRDILLFTLKT